VSLNKDNLLFTLVGILLGFISAYFLFEAMAARQPPRLGTAGAPMGAAPPMGQPAGPPGGDPAAGNAGMAEIEELRARVERNPNDADAVRQLADLNFQISRWDRARELYTRYLELRPGDLEAKTALGAVQIQAGDTQKALDLFREVHEASPEHWQSYFYEVIALATLNRFDEASKVLDRLEQLQPSNPDVQRLAAEVRQRSGGASGGS
jgi:tetratricopeptide (TPR) repeat protein